MVSVGSLPVDGKCIFDLDSQSGVMHLLASIRSSDIDASQKAELRDLVFLYTNGGKDQTVRLSLEQKISAHNVVPAPQKKSPELKKDTIAQPTIGKYRVAPIFNVAAPIKTPTPAPQAPVQSVAAPEPVRQAPSPVFPEPVVPVPPIEVVPPSAREPEPVVVLPVSSIPTPPPPTPEPVQKIEVSQSVEPARDNQQYLQRIRDIKAAVNEKVGNPVNLVDINNEVGREYMGALLDAMKKLNSGSSAGSAMKRLEDAYAQVLTVVDLYQANGGPQAAFKVAPTITPEPAMAEPVVSEYKAPPPPPPEPSRPIVETPPVVPPQSEVSAAPTAWVDKQPTSPQPASFTSLADVERKSLSMSDLPTTAQTKTSGATEGDPLFSPEVEEGLAQLLSEWSIFKKSGIFGSGPKGKDHPLFKKMAPLHIPLLLAGRFEGATQEVKQSVTDYMNGWRYEQGLIYQQGETFEHYLRRVIRHILDLQKG